MGVMPSDGGDPLDRALLSLADRIYAAATDFSQWQVVIDDLVRLLGGYCGNCVVLRPRNTAEASFWAASASTPDGVLDDYVAYYHQKDVVMAAIERRPDIVGKPVTIKNLMKRADFRQSELYNDYLSPGGVQDTHVIAIGAAGAAMPQTIINVLRTSWSEDDDPRARYVLETLKPHFERALGLYWRLADARGRVALAEAGMDRLGVGFMVLNSHGYVRMMNGMAERILGAQDGLALANRQLVAANRADAETLRLMIAKTCHLNGSLDRGGVAVIRRPSGARPYIVTLVPSSDFGALGGACIAYIKDPSRDALPAPELLARVFGFTPAEARLAAALATGQTIQDIADSWSVSRNTIKTHLRGAFAKTETSRQSDLVRIVRSSLPVAGGG